MSIINLDGYIAGAKQIVLQRKTASITAVAQMITSPFAAAGIPGAGTLAGTNASVGVLQTDALAGYPVIAPFTGSKGYISRLNGYSSVTGAILLVDELLKLGTFAYNAAVSGLTTVDISSRVPASGWGGLEIWLEQVTAMTGNQTIAITYIDGNDVAQTTGSVATAVAPIVGRCFRMPMAGTGFGVKSITGVVSSVSTAGTFNVLIVRPLATMRIPLAGYSEARDLYGTGMPEIFADSALAVFVRPDSTASGLPEWEIEIVNG